MNQLTAATHISFGYIYVAMPVDAALTIAHLLLVARSWVVKREFVADPDFDASASAAL